jgi:predicted MFS family arabinose efflux permease
MSARLLLLPLLALALGHMLSNAVRTIPAIAADLLQRDLGMTAEHLAALSGAYLFAFAAAQIPIGVALDRYGVRPVSLALFAGVVAGALLAAAAGGPVGFLLAQIVMGLGSAGMLITPMTFAAKTLTPAQFGLWSGLIQAVGNAGMLLSASPLALLIEAADWRAGFLACAAFGVFAGLLVRLLVPPPKPDATGRALAEDAAEVLRLFASRALAPLVALAFASFAAVMGVRGLWGGPWLMEVKGLSRIEAGHVLLIATFALVAGPVLGGLLDRALGRRVALLAAGHALAGLCLAAIAARPGATSGWDAGVLVLFGLTISVQPLIFALTRAAVPREQTGKALAAVNLSFFTGAAVLQSVSGVAAAWGGPGGGIAFFAAALLVATAAFLGLVRRAG